MYINKRCEYLRDVTRKYVATSLVFLYFWFPLFQVLKPFVENRIFVFFVQSCIFHAQKANTFCNLNKKQSEEYRRTSSGYAGRVTTMSSQDQVVYLEKFVECTFVVLPGCF